MSSVHCAPLEGSSLQRRKQVFIFFSIFGFVVCLIVSCHPFFLFQSIVLPLLTVYQTCSAPSAGCVECGQGFFNPTSGQAFCDSCPAGKYSEAATASECVDCDPGMYQPEVGATECLNCTHTNNHNNANNANIANNANKANSPNNPNNPNKTLIKP